jgi:hypothetical protein
MAFFVAAVDVKNGSGEKHQWKILFESLLPHRRRRPEIH